MCEGMQFCSGCRNEEVEVWAAGKTHQLPKFGDNAQRATAIRRRQIVFLNALRNNDNLIVWPEWLIACGRMGVVGMFTCIYMPKTPLPPIRTSQFNLCYIGKRNATATLD